MKKCLLILALIAISFLNSYSQTIFEKGYIITNSNESIDCLVKNLDWKNNPTELEYRLSESDDIRLASITDVAEFGIGENVKYIRSTVTIDKSSDYLNNMSKVKEPSFSQEQLFLRVLIGGKTSLLVYRNPDVTRFFYQLNDSTPVQLIYKRYKTDDSYIIKNNSFRQQLYTKFKCPVISLKDIEYIDYNQKELERFFQKYNECTNSAYVNYTTKQKKDLFNLSIRPGLNLNSLTLSNHDLHNQVDFGKQLNFRLGLETEFILPFNKNKWGIIFEPAYQYYNAERSWNEDKVIGGILIANINYRTLELPLGLRHYSYLNNKSKLFLNASFVYSVDLNSSIIYTRSDGSYYNSIDTKSRAKFVFGTGYKYDNKYSVEIQYQMGGAILDYYKYSYSDYNTTSIIFGYTILSKH